MIKHINYVDIFVEVYKVYDIVRYLKYILNLFYCSFYSGKDFTDNAVYNTLTLSNSLALVLGFYLLCGI